MIPLFCLDTRTTLYLASHSPRRRDFLAEWGVAFEFLDGGGEEPQPFAGEDPETFTLRCAEKKGTDAFQTLAPHKKDQALILAADTVVSIDKDILGKPKNSKEALSMLTRLCGRCHLVSTAVHLLFPAHISPRSHSFVSSATVCMHNFSKDILQAYVATGESLDKAGAYAVQGQGAFLVERIDGSWSTVVGLPLTPLAQILLSHKLLIPQQTKKEGKQSGHQEICQKRAQ